MTIAEMDLELRIAGLYSQATELMQSLATTSSITQEGREEAQAIWDRAQKLRAKAKRLREQAESGGPDPPLWDA